MDERSAITQLQQGDIGGLELLVRLHQLRALRTAYLITRDRALAEDIVQSAFLRVYERIHQFDARQPFAPWFLRSVVNDALKASARGTRLVPLDTDASAALMALDQQVADLTLQPEQVADQHETRDAIWAALDALSVQQRTAIVQRYYLDMSEAEMACAAGCAPGNHQVAHKRRTRTFTRLAAPSCACTEGL